MKILVVSDEEDKYLWDYYTPGKLSEYGLILSAGDLKAKYLSFLVTMARCPLLYIHGNHDRTYETNPPEGCDCIEDELIVYRGIRILGLGGCRRYNPGSNQYTEKEMRKRAAKLKKKIDRACGVDIILTHAPARGYGDEDNPCHKGFDIFTEMIEQYQPKYFVHGHVHLNYGFERPRLMQLGSTVIVNASGRYVIEIDEPEQPLKIKKGLFGGIFSKNRPDKHERMFSENLITHI